MLEKIRENSQGLVAKIILGFIILTFALAGISSYLGGSVDVSSAVVNGEEITKASYTQAYQSQRRRMESQFGQMFEQLAADPSYMQNFRKNVLDNLINEALQGQLVEELGMRISDNEIKDAIRKMPEFQVDGQFNNERYLMLIRQAGFQPSAFRDMLRKDMAVRQLAQSVIGTNFALTKETTAYNALQKQSRSIDYVEIDKNQYTAGVEITDEEKADYYQANIDRWETQEKVSVDYVELKMSDLMPLVDVTEDDAEAYYNEYVESYKTTERRKASHILIEIAEDEAAAEQEAQDLLAKINAGESFEELAKAHSDDTFSGENGGDLDWMTQGDMDPAFDDAVFAMTNEGDISDVVKSSFGYHIIKLTGIEASVTSPFADVKADILEKLKADKANDLFAERQEALTNASYENPDSLEDAAAAVEGQIVSSDAFTRNDAAFPLNAPAVVAAAFSDQVLVENINSEVLSVSNDHIVVIHLKEHFPARTQSAEEVDAQVIEALTNQKATEKAREAAEGLMAKLKDSADAATVVAADNLTLKSEEKLERFSGATPVDIRNHAFKMAKPAADAQTFDLVEMTNGNYAVIKLNSVSSGLMTADDTTTQQRLSSLYSQSGFQSFVDSLSEGATIERLDTEIEEELY